MCVCVEERERARLRHLQTAGNAILPKVFARFSASSADEPVGRVSSSSATRTKKFRISFSLSILSILDVVVFVVVVVSQEKSSISRGVWSRRFSPSR